MIELELTPGEIAPLLDVDRTTVLRWIYAGRFGETRRKGFGRTTPHMVKFSAVLEVASKLEIDATRIAELYEAPSTDNNSRSTPPTPNDSHLPGVEE